MLLFLLAATAAELANEATIVGAAVGWPTALTAFVAGTEAVAVVAVDAPIVAAVTDDAVADVDGGTMVAEAVAAAARFCCVVHLFTIEL